MGSEFEAADYDVPGTVNAEMMTLAAPDEQVE